MKRFNEDLLNNILKELEKDNKVTQVYLANKYSCNERTIRRYIKVLKEQKKIKMESSGRKKKWIV